jgi:hypothetical protein
LFTDAFIAGSFSFTLGSPGQWAASWIEAHPELVTGAHGPYGLQQMANDLRLWREEIEQANRQLLENLFGMMIRQLRPGG